ncbi:MAG: T9SS type A sorting domain-containing protein [Bacteroidia bacterium]|nr:T9SS type A sorting domain-containing protein [Bacteroidia bacterium]
MRLNIFTLLFLSISSLLIAQPKKIKLDANDTRFGVLSKGETSLKFINEISAISAFDVKVKDKIFTQLQIDGYTNNRDIGYPQLLVLHQLIEAPYDAEIKIKIVSFEEQAINLSDHEIYNKIIPAQPSLSKSDDPDKAPFHYNESYYQFDDFNNTQIVDADILGVMRGVQIGRLNIRPIRYNPVKNVLKVINKLIVEIEFEHPNLALTKAAKEKYYSPCFETNFSKLINHQKSQEKDVITQYPVKYVIVSDTMFQAALQPFIQWKTRKGFHVTEAYTNNPSVGNTTTSIKNYLQNLYTSATPQDPAPSFILFVGDVAQMPNFTGQAGSHVTDLYYCTYDGTSDYFPDVYYGRFSATNVTQLQPQIDKTLEYEQYLFPDPSFLNEVVMIAGVDANNAPTWGNGQINYGTDYYFNAQHGLLSHTYLYPASETSAAQIINDVSKGVGFANYTAHGGPDGWSDPAFSVSDIATLDNAHRYPLMVGNCCSTNTFDNAECFGEALLRASGKGALGYIGGSNSTYWDEDYWWGVGAKTVVVNPPYDSTKLGSYDCMYHESGEPNSAWFVTNGQMIHAGNLAVAQGGGSIQYYWEIYHLMGDPSIMVYFSVPPDLAITYNSAIPVGISTLNVTTEPNAYVAISLNNVLLDAKLADNTGIVQLSFPAFSSPCTADIVATKQNRKPYIGSLTVIPSTTPYVSYFSHIIDDSAENNNHQAEYDETILLDVALKDVGLYDAQGVNALLSTTDTNVTIIDNTQAYGNITSGQTITINAAYSLHVKPYVEDQHNVIFTLAVTDNNSNSWNSNFVITLNAPKLKVLSYWVEDPLGNGNGRLDPGETAAMKIVTNNYGHSVSPVATGSLSTTNTFLNITNPTQTLGTLNANSNDTVTFDITVDMSASLGSYAAFTYIADANPYGATKIFNVPIGQLVEDWECQGFIHYPFVNTSAHPWTIDSQVKYEGAFSAKSGTINDLQTTQLTIYLNVITSDSISFYRKVSSENTYDFLRFYIDNNQNDEWSGEQDWARAAYPIAAGPHMLKWAYEKDYSATGGSDCSWIDFIVFPPTDNLTNILSSDKDNNEFSVYPNIFNDKTDISYKLSKNSIVTLQLFNSLGQEIETIINQNQATGNYNLQYTNKNHNSGVYYLKLMINEKPVTHKIIITK